MFFKVIANYKHRTLQWLWGAVERVLRYSRINCNAKPIEIIEWFLCQYRFINAFEKRYVRFNIALELLSFVCLSVSQSNLSEYRAQSSDESVSHNNVVAQQVLILFLLLLSLSLLRSIHSINRSEYANSFNVPHRSFTRDWLSPLIHSFIRIDSTNTIESVRRWIVQISKTIKNHRIRFCLIIYAVTSMNTPI